MEERKLRIAFAKVKKDINSLRNEITDVSKLCLIQDNKTSEKGIDRIRFENFVNNVEKEFKEILLYTKELDDKLSNVSDSVKQNAKNPKLSKDSKDFEYVDRKLSEFGEILNEKIEIEMSAIKLEFTEEIAKLYDRIFTELIELKDEINKTKKGDSSGIKKDKAKEEPVVEQKSKKTQKEVTKNIISEDNSFVSDEGKKEGKFKKMMNWLFVDEEESDLEDVKSEVKSKKKDKNSNKEDLY